MVDMLRSIPAEPITAEAFAPFGEVLRAPQSPGRDYFDAALGNARPAARASLSLCRVAPTDLPLEVMRMERHRFSSQSFIPMEAAGYLAIVAPHAPEGGPDGPRARAFLLPGRLGITYHPDVWHYSLTVLECAGTFAIIMWRDGSAGDEEFATLAIPFRVELAR